MQNGELLGQEWHGGEVNAEPRRFLESRGLTNVVLPGVVEVEGEVEGEVPT